jgi:hypothetical protein
MFIRGIPLHTVDALCETTKRIKDIIRAIHLDPVSVMAAAENRSKLSHTRLLVMIAKSFWASSKEDVP